MPAKKRKSLTARKGGTKKTVKKKTAVRAVQKQSGRGRKNASSSRKEKKEEKQIFDFPLGKEIAVILAFGFALLLFISCFQKPGSSLTWLQTGIFWLCGDTSYVMPVFLFLGVFFVIAEHGRRVLWPRLAAVFLFFASVCGTCVLLLQDGGLIGNGMMKLFIPALGSMGAYVVMVLMFLIGFVLLTGRSFVTSVKKNSEKARDVIRSGQEIRRGEMEIWNRERELRKEQRKSRRLQEQKERIEELEAEKEKEIANRNEMIASVSQNHFVVEEDTENPFEEELVVGSRPKKPGRDSAGMSSEMRNSSSGGEYSGEIHFSDEPDEEEPLPVRELSRTAKELSSLDWMPLKETENPLTENFEEAERKQTVSLKSRKKFSDISENSAEDLSENAKTEKIVSKSAEGIVQNRKDRFPKSAGAGENASGSAEDIVQNRKDRFPENAGAGANALRGAEDAVPKEQEETEKFSDDSAGEEELPFFADGSGSREKYSQELPSEALPDPRVKKNYSNLSENYAENRVKTVVTASGKIITAELDGLPGERKLPKDVRPREKEESSAVHPETYVEPKEYEYPSVSFLKKGTVSGVSREETAKHLKETAWKLQQTLQNFGVGVTVTNISCGPAVTRYELQPEQGVKVSRIVSLTDDIKLNLAAADIRMEAPIPGKAAIGIEVPNQEKQAVMLRDLLDTEEFRKHPSKIVFAAGKDIGGNTVLADIAKMPHLLIAGATGSGKSVCINTIIMSILYKARPSEVKMILIDPKVVELSVYNGIPHLLIPVVTDPKKAAAALNWAVREMTERYQKFAEYHVRDMKGYNAKIEELRKDLPEGTDGPSKMPQIVVIVDELADLMMVASDDVEEAICRLAQLARAAGIHLVIATQRPSVNVITGLIKANMPSRIAFSVTSGVDSRTILDMSGAEKLLGKGDMLFYPSGYPKPIRVQGCFVSDEEVAEVTKFLCDQKNVVGGGTDSNISLETADSGQSDKGSASGKDRDEYFDQAARFLISQDKVSIGMLQREYKVGFNRAARIMKQLADAGIVSEEDGTKPRKVLMKLAEYEEMIRS